MIIIIINIYILVEPHTHNLMWIMMISGHGYGAQCELLKPLIDKSLASDMNIYHIISQNVCHEKCVG